MFGHRLKILLLFLWGQPKLDPYSLWMVCYGQADLGRRLTAAGDVVFSGGLSSNMLGRLILIPALTIILMAVMASDSIEGTFMLGSVEWKGPRESK